MKRGIIILTILIIFLAGCKPDVVCNDPYMRHGDDCCMDENHNQLCDDDEKSSDDFFMTPEYAPDDNEEFVEPVYEEEDRPTAYEYTSDDRYEEPTPVEITEEELPEPLPPKTPYTYTPKEPEIKDWEAENDLMSMKITKIVIEKRSIKPKDLTSLDYEVHLKEIHMTIADKRYGEPYLLPKLKIKIGDSFDPLIVAETLDCDSSDDLEMEGCRTSLKDTESNSFIIHVNTKMSRPDVEKDFYFELQNKRDTMSDSSLMIEKEYPILSIPGAVYT